VTWDEVGEEEGTGIVHIAPGCGAEDFALGKKLGLPMIGPWTGTGRAARLRPTRAATSATWPTRSWRRSGIATAYRSRRSPADPLGGLGNATRVRLVERWYVSIGAVYGRFPRSADARAGRGEPALPDHGRDPRHQVDPGFGYERELDWLLNMHDWMISKKRYWGLALADIRLRVVRHGQRRRWAGGAGRAGRRGLGPVRGPHPHRPYVDKVRIRCSGAASRESDRRLGNPWLDAASSVLDDALPQRPRLLEGLVPGRLRDGELPRPVPQLVLLAPGHEHGAAREAPVQDALRLRPGIARTAARCTRAGATPSSSTRRPSGWRGRHALDVRQRTAGDNINFGWHAADERAGGCSFCGMSTRSSSPTSPGRMECSGRRASGAERGPLDRWILSRLAGWRRRGGRSARVRRARRRQSDRRFIEELSTWYLRLSRDRMRQGAERASETPLLPRSTRRSCRSLGFSAPILPFLSEAIYQNLSSPAKWTAFPTAFI